MENGSAMVPVQAGMTMREEVGATQMARSAETSQTALAATAEAEVKARFVMAERNPRSVDDARVRMLAECKRPGFADVAMYRKPIGGGKSAEGLSIRFAEAARRAWRNMDTSTVVILDDAEKRIVRVRSIDLESNNSESVDVIIEKTVERKFLKDGQVPLRSRLNSYNDLVYLIPADEGSLLTKEKAECAKAKRGCILALIPGDILDECKAKIRFTQNQRDAADPAAAKKALCDAFAEIGIMPSDLEDRYLGHPVEGMTPTELLDLKGVYVAIKEGDCTWNEAVAVHTGEADGAKANSKVSEAKAKIAERTDRIKNKGKPQKAAPPSDPGATDDEQARAIDRGQA